MELFKQLIIQENEIASYKELKYFCTLINKSYNEWRKIHRRINAVDIVTTTVNRLYKISPESVDFLDSEMKMRLAILLMRCMDNPWWKPLMNKEKIYKKLYPLISKLQSFTLNTGTGGNLKEIIMTRLSANMCAQDDDNNRRVFVAYEPKITVAYEKYLFGDSQRPQKIYKMTCLSIPEDYVSLLDILEINYNKVIKSNK